MTTRINELELTGTADLEDIIAALQGGNIPTLQLVLATLTGDHGWLDGPYRGTPAAGPGDHDTGGLSEERQAEIRRAVAEVLTDLTAGRRVQAPPPGPDQVVAMLSTSLHTEIPLDGGELLAEELGLLDRWVDVPACPGLDVAIVGSGFSGIAAAVSLQRAGVPYMLIEKNRELGGTWYENRYPGAGVDTPSHLYSFSWAKNARWSGYFCKGPEVRDYLNRVAAEHDVINHIRFGREVTHAVWREDDARWELTLRGADGTEESLTARVLISAVGLLNRPAFPEIAGLGTFAGPCFHSAQWRDDVDLAGKRVAVLGTGASSMQLVTAIAGIAEHVTVFQRTAQWAIPHPNQDRQVPAPVQVLLESLPHYAGWYRLRQVWNSGDRLHPVVQVDPGWPHQHRSINKANESHRKFLTQHIINELGERTELITKCVPTYPPYGKRPLLDHGWFRTVARDDVTVITDDVTEIRPTGLITADGSEHGCDVLVLATGFQALNMLAPMDIRGRSGTGLRDVWGPDDARAYLGLTVPDYPNLFCLWGPNSNAGHGGSHALSAELQVRYILEMLALMAENGITSIEPCHEVFDDYNRRLDEALARTIWTHPGMNNYYRNSRGRVVYNMPWTNTDYWRLVRRPDLDDFVLGGATHHSTSSPSISLGGRVRSEGQR